MTQKYHTIGNLTFKMKKNLKKKLNNESCYTLRRFWPRLEKKQVLFQTYGQNR